MSYDFDGSGSANLNVATPITTLPVTMACWFKAAADGAGHTLICIGSGANPQIFRLTASFDVGGDPVGFRATGTTGVQENLYTSGGSPSVDTWHHACAVAASNVARAVYLDGGAKASTGSGGSRTISSATLLSIGAQYQNGSFGVDTEGKIAHVAIWDVALSDGEVALLAAGDNPLTIQPDHLIAYWPLTSDLVDVVDGLTLTNGGGATLSGDNPEVDAPPGGGPVSLTPAALASTTSLSSPTLGGMLVPDSLVSGTGLTAASVQPDIVIAEPADRGRVDLAASGIVIDGGNVIVDLYARPSTDHESGSTSGDTRAQVVYARVSGVQGVASLRFRVRPPLTGSATGWYANDRIMWRVTGSGPDGWQYFTTSSGGSGASKLGYNATPFAVDEIDIAFNLPFPLAEIDDWMTGLIGSGYAVEPASSTGGGAYTYATLDGSLFSDDRTGGTLAAATLRQRCIELRDPAATPPVGRTKALIVLASGVHASEDAGTHSLRHHVAEWLSNIEYRRRCDLAIYPTVGPSGRYVGRRRGTSQTAAISGKTNGSRGTATVGEDLNREFPDSSGAQWSIENTNTRAAFAADSLFARIIATGGALIDWHTDGVGSDPVIYVYTGTSDADDDRAAAWVAASDAYISGTVDTAYSSQDSLRKLAAASGVTFAATVEFGHNTADLIGFVEEVGVGFALGMIDAFDAGVIGGYAITPVNVAVAVALDAATLTSISSISPANVAVAVSLDEATLASAGTVSPANLSVPASLDAAALTVASAISPNDVAVPVAIDGANLTTGASVEPDDVSVAVSVEAAALESVSAITPGDLTVAVSLDAAEITSGASVMPADINVAVSIGSPTLAAESVVAPNDVSVVVYLSQIILNGTSAPTVTPPERRAAATGESRRAAA